MALKIYNSLGKEKQEFEPMEEGEVKMYTCGPTVYDLPHIGNYRTFFMSDMIVRYLEFKGFNVFHVMNLTDIDDKTIEGSKEEEMSLREYTDKYIDVFLEGLDDLNMERAMLYPRATEHVNEMIETIKNLEENGLAYDAEDAVYFDISEFDDYGKLSQIDLNETKEGARVNQQEYDKKDASDFALWKKSTEEEIERGIYFDSPWGKGRPGWHIECSTMSTCYLGDTFDIHTGGVDLMFPHHENEIAQSEGAHEQKFVNYWIHGEHLLSEGEKMSKSKGNYFTLYDLLEKYDVNTIRHFFLSTHYRQQINYTERAMENAEKNAKKLEETLRNIEAALNSDEDLEFTEGDEEFLKDVRALEQEFEGSMDDDFDTPSGLKVVHKLSKRINRYLNERCNKGVLREGVNIYRNLLSVFGLFEETEEGTSDLEADLLDLIVEIRNGLREKEEYELSDQIREKLKEKGVELEDHGEETRWKKV